MADNMPVGSIINYAGPITSSTTITLDTQGWLICDGSQYSTTDFAELFAAIGYAHGGSGALFNVPDLRGMFVRGVNGDARKLGRPVDPDTDSRTAPAAGGNSGNAVGSVQAYATAKPNADYDSDSAGDHAHSADHLPDSNHKAYAGSVGRVGAKWNSSSSVKTKQAGLHSHTITGGGDSETRPANMAQYFLIKFKTLS
ncbi:tail fiber protein [Mangrovimicrobium sediminis]|uniref:Tail fiber protein n=1 Tax=Mangrovimicrobium sediminis TaxID=2562682 RepID=A0A4Z0M1V2_9GAMM|nr:tail fiber protein [Haliea sp. SAOS-164]TGD73521.1 tail fiber protein [Haliea sp. SAOS-164]